MKFHHLLAAAAVMAGAGLGADPPPSPVAFFDGKDLAGWTLVTSPKAEIARICRVTPEGVIAVTGKPVGYLLADGVFQNYRLHVEWRWPVGAAANSNSGVLIHIASGPVNQTAWPECFQIQTKLTRAGDILPMGGAGFAEKVRTPAGARFSQRERQGPASEKPFGQWNSCDLVCRDGAIECRINGVLQNRVTHCRPASGQIGIQLEGTPFELRNLRCEPLP